MSQEIVTSLKVDHDEPVKMFFSNYALKFWLVLTVDNGSRVATGRSHPVMVEINKPSIEEARRAAFAIERIAQDRLKGLDFIEALLAFPSMIADLAGQGEE